MGTSAFTANGWRGTFYPSGLKPSDYLSFYATRFDTVEVDSTFYGTPSVSTVKAWNAKTPPGFVFAAKVPQVITHKKVLVDCDAEFKEFIGLMDNLGDKLGPLLLQFGFFNTTVFRGVNDYAGFGPATVEMFRDLWRKQVPEVSRTPKQQSKVNSSNEIQDSAR